MYDHTQTLGLDAAQASIADFHEACTQPPFSDRSPRSLMSTYAAHALDVIEAHVGLTGSEDHILEAIDTKSIGKVRFGRLRNGAYQFFLFKDHSSLVLFDTEDGDVRVFPAPLQLSLPTRQAQAPGFAVKFQLNRDQPGGDPLKIVVVQGERSAITLLPATVEDLPIELAQFFANADPVIHRADQLAKDLPQIRRPNSSALEDGTLLRHGLNGCWSCDGEALYWPPALSCPAGKGERVDEAAGIVNSPPPKGRGFPLPA